ncbi:MAG: radical SAM protein, partial [Elusimicrobiota bacterium]
MKILLVNPSASVWQQTKIIPLGLAYIAAVLEKAGHSVQVIDLNHEKSFVLPKTVDLVGITAASSTIEYAWDIAKQVKEKNILTVLGGPHVTILPEESLQHKEVDFVVRGEGEETIVELISSLEKNESLTNVRGISFKENNRIVHNQNRPFIENLDKLPFPAYHLFPPIKHYKSAQPFLARRRISASIMTSRGCPFNCVFCYKGMFGHVWRSRSPENIIDEWKFLVKELKVKEIRIQDDIFNQDIKRAEKICEMIKDNNIIVPWSLPNGIRADKFNVTLISKMKQSGCFQVAFGVESGDQTVLNNIGKKLDL